MWGYLMGGVTSALPHLSEFEVSIRLKQTAGREHCRWLIIWNALVDPRPAWEIALHTGGLVSTVHHVISRYNRFGPETIEGHEHGIRRRCSLSKDEEVEFLRPFLELAPRGRSALQAGSSRPSKSCWAIQSTIQRCIGCSTETDGGKSCLGPHIPRQKRKLKRL